MSTRAIATDSAAVPTRERGYDDDDDADDADADDGTYIRMEVSDSTRISTVQYEDSAATCSAASHG